MPHRAVEDRARSRIRTICDAGGDARALRLDVLDEIRRCVPFDAYAWLLTDPDTSVGSAPLADVPCLDDLPTLIRLKYQTSLNRWTTLETSRTRTLLEASRGDPARSLVWRELLSGLGVVDVASAVFRDRSGCWAFLDLWRLSARPPFGPDEVRFLDSVGRTVASGLRRAQARTFEATGGQGREPAGPAVLLLSGDLELRARTPESDGYLRRLVPPAEGWSAVPAGAYNVAAQLLAGEAGVDRHPPRTRVHLGDGVWLTVRAARMDGSRMDGSRMDGSGMDRSRMDRSHPPGVGTGDGPGDIAVTLERASPADRVDLFARASALTPRETALLGRLAAGTDTRHTARLLSVSEHTVQDHLKSVFAKTGTRSRAELLARALGGA